MAMKMEHKPVELDEKGFTKKFRIDFTFIENCRMGFCVFKGNGIFTGIYILYFQ